MRGLIFFTGMVIICIFAPYLDDYNVEEGVTAGGRKG